MLVLISLHSDPSIIGLGWLGSLLKNRAVFPLTKRMVVSLWYSCLVKGVLERIGKCTKLQKMGRTVITHTENDLSLIYSFVFQFIALLLYSGSSQAVLPASAGGRADGHCGGHPAAPRGRAQHHPWSPCAWSGSALPQTTQA